MAGLAWRRACALPNILHLAAQTSYPRGRCRNLDTAWAKNALCFVSCSDNNKKQRNHAFEGNK
jgi:hypothetical protein